MGKQSERQTFVFDYLILALLHEWTLGRNPQKDFKELGITKDDAMSAIHSLIGRGLVKPTVQNMSRTLSAFYILIDFKSFHEAYILTEEGVSFLKSIELEDLKASFIRWQE